MDVVKFLYRAKTESHTDLPAKKRASKRNPSSRRSVKLLNRNQMFEEATKIESNPEVRYGGLKNR